MNVTKLKVVNDDNERLRQIEPLHEEIKQGKAKFSEPERVLRRPESIMIDPDFQRNLSPRSKRLIKRMIRGWDWALFVPPAIYADESGVELAYDGQHTLIAAATRDDIDMLPMDLHKEIPNQEAAANAFVGRNTERLGVTSFQKYKAALVAGQYWAVTIEKASQKLGFRVPFYADQAGKPDQVMAIGTMKELLDLRGEAKFVQVMRVLSGKNIRPIREFHLRAIDILLNDPTYKDVGIGRLDGLLRLIDNDLFVKEVISDAAGSGLPRHQMAAIAYYRRYQGQFGVSKRS